MSKSLAYSLGILSAICAAFLLASTSVSAATNISSCGVLDQANETYVLAQDVSSSGTCFALSADYITLDLNGHTVTYGTSGGDKYFGVAIPPGYATDITRDRYPGLPDAAFGGASHAIIHNGTINQSSNGGSDGHAIYGRLYTEIYDITSTVYGDDTDNIYFVWANNVKIHNNTLYNNSTVVTNRHQGKGVIESLRDGGNTKIYNNTIVGGPQWGIRLSHNSGGETGFEIYGNTISQNAYVANPYAIGAHADNTLVYDNTITPTNGRGIHVLRDSIKVYNNTITVKEGPNNEYAGGWSHGIKLEGSTNAKVYSNSVTALAGSGFGSAYALDVSVNAGSNNEVYNNVFTATTSSASETAAATHFLAVESGNGLDLHHNTFRSNNMLVFVDWDNAQDVLFRSNTFEQTGTPVNFQTLRFGQESGAASNGFTFLDSSMGTGTSLVPPSYRSSSTLFSYTIEQYLQVIAKNGSNGTVAQATVTIKNKNGETVASGKTNSSGVYLSRVVSNQISGPSVSNVSTTPHTVSISASGYAGDSHTVTLDASKTVTFTLTSTNSSSTDSTYTPPGSYTPPGVRTEYKAPTTSGKNIIIAAPQKGGGPIVRVFDSQYRLRTQFLAFAGDFRGGIKTVSADLQGDGVEEIVVVPASDAGPHVKVFDANGVELDSKFVTSLGYRGGFQLTAADVDGDEKDEIILGTNRGGGPQVIVYDFEDGKLKYHKAFFVYAQSLRSGIQIATGDVDGDGVDEIITAPNHGGGPHIRAFEHNGKSIGGFFAYAEGLRTGVKIAAADVNQDGREEIITVPNSGAPSNVAVWTYKGKFLAGFYALPPHLRMGVTIQAGDVDDDGVVEIITTALAGGGPQVSIFNWKGRVEERWFAYAPWDRFGLHANLIDVDLDGDLEIVTVPGRGDGPLVKIFDSRGRQYKQFFSHGSGGFKGGIQLSSAVVE